eukprot:COSAG02_NODE_2193_length_9555_cov_102.183481_11_plen_287_part_00
MVTKIVMATTNDYPPPVAWLSDYPPTILRFRPADHDVEKVPLILEYFAYRALAEHLKLLLEITATPYDLVCHWSPHFMGAVRYRDYAPHGQLPMLTDPALGFQLVESAAIFRHIARSTGVAGRTAAEGARIDMLCELAEDVRTNTDWMANSDRYMEAAERAVAAGCPPADGEVAAPRCLVGDTLTAADVWMFWALHYIVDTKPSKLEPYTALQQFHSDFLALPAVSAFYASARAMPLCKYQKDPQNVSGAYEVANYTYDPPYQPAIYAERWVPDATHPAAGAVTPT